MKAGAGGTVDVTLRGRSLISAGAADLQGCTGLTVTSDYQRTSAEVTGTAEPLAGSVEGDQRPQMVGLFTDLQGAAPADLNVHVDLDSRFSSSPTLLKLLAMIVCVLATLTSLYALHRVDGIDGRRARRFLPAHWWKFTGVDAS